MKPSSDLISRSEVVKAISGIKLGRFKDKAIARRVSRVIKVTQYIILARIARMGSVTARKGKRKKK